MIMKITEDDVIESLELFTRVPSFILRRWARGRTNLASRFRSQIIEGYSQLSESDRERVRAVLQMDVSDIQNILEAAHLKTGKRQLGILADPSSRNFIEINLGEIRNILSQEFHRD